MVRDALREMAIRGCGAEEAVEGRREGWSGGAVRSHCAGVSADLVGQDDREVELRGETARRGRCQGAVLHVRDGHGHAAQGTRGRRSHRSTMQPSARHSPLRPSS